MAIASSDCKNHNLGQSVAASARFVEDRNKVTIIEFAGNYDKDIGDTCNVEPRAIIAREFYKKHVDNYDFLVIFTKFEFTTGEALAFHSLVKNNVRGIGRPLGDSSAIYGSNGRLQATIDMAALSRYAAYSSHKDFDKVVTTFAHEYLHQWAAHVRFRDSNGNLSDALLGKDAGHWSYLLDTGASVLYGSRWRDNGDGSFTAVATRQLFSPLDLYLMGVYSKDEVPPFFLIVNPDVDRTKLPELNATVRGTKTIVTIDDIIAAEGPRVPSSGQASTDSRIAFIYLVRPGDQATDDELGQLEEIRQAISTRIPVLTGGRVAINVYPATRALDPVAQSPLLSDDGAKLSSVQTDSAMAWLRSRQATEGSFGDSAQTRVRDSAVVLAALKRLDGTFNGIDKGRDWISSQELGSTDFVARRGMLLASLGNAADDDRVRLVGTQNADGGWGMAGIYRSNPLDTALALQALRRLGGASQETQARAIQYLGLTQNADGGWGNVDGGPSRSLVTTQALQALVGRAEAEGSVSKAIAWIKSKQNADGGFGDSPSTVHDTANALLALSAAGATQAIDASRATQFIAANQKTDGSWQGSVYATALSLDALKRMSFFNWNVAKLTATPTKLTDGQRATLEIEVRNDGNLATPIGLLRILDGNPAAGGQAVGDVVLPPMAPGSALAAEVSWNSFRKPGNHTLYAVADPDGVFAELSETDNSAFVAIAVADAPSAPDLLVAAPDIVVSPAKPDRLPSPLAISATVSNTGQTGVAAVRVTLREGAAGTGTLVGDTMIAVPARGSAVANFNVQLTRPAAVYAVEVDPDGAIAEISRANNVATVQVDTAATVDLEVLSTDIQHDPVQVMGGDDVTFRVRLRNRGTVDSPSVRVRHALVGGGTEVELAASNVQLGAGQQLEQAVVWRADRTGAFDFTTSIDVGNAVAEADESNNTASHRFSVSALAGVNLSVSHKDLRFAPDPALEGADLKVSAVVGNVGSIAASNIPVAFYNGDPASGGTLIGEMQSIPVLEAGASANVQVTWPSLAGNGDRLVFVVVDPQDTIAETSKADNTAFNVLSVKSLPDLAVSGADIVTAPAVPKPGDSVTVTVAVANLGQQPANGFIVRLYDGDPAAGGVQVGGDQRMTLAPMTSGTTSWIWKPASQDAVRLLSVVVDPDNQVAEGNKDNNRARREFLLQNAAFAVSNRYFSPNGDGIQDTTVLSYRLDTPADVAISVIDRRNREVRREAGPQFSSATGSFEWDGLDNRGRLVMDGNYRLRVLSSGGAVLGEVAVTLDTNRSPLFDAFGTPYQLITNQTCDLANYDQLVATDDEQSQFARHAAGDAFYPAGIYRASAYGSDWRAVVTAEQLASVLGIAPGQIEISRFAVSGDGGRVALVVTDFLHGVTSLWSSDGDGRGLVRLVDGQFESVLFGRDPKRIFSIYRANYNEPYRLMAVNAGLPLAMTEVVGATPDDWSYLQQVDVSRDRRRLLVQREDWNVGRAWLVDLDMAQAHETVALPWLQWSAAALSPNGELLAVAADAGNCYECNWDSPSRGTATVRVYETAGGSLVREFNYGIDQLCQLWMEADPNGGNQCDYNLWMMARSISWAASGQELVFRAAADYDGESEELSWLVRGDVVTGEVEPVARALTTYPYYWAPAERNLLAQGHWGQNAPLQGVLLDDDAKPVAPDKYPRRSLMAEWNDYGLELQGFSASGRRFSFTSNRDAADGGSVCYGRGYTDTFSFESLLNLTADLRPVRSTTSGGIRIRGTAADRNFSRYRLDYALATAPNDWRPIQPAVAQPVVDQHMTTWVPPAYGTYFVRLIVEDLAGNARTVVKRVSWSDTPAITDLWRKPEYISPNGDTVQDGMVFHYKVLEPVHLEFAFFNAGGDNVRTITRDHSTIGGEYELTWDGRDEVGRTLPDGEYRLVVENYEFFVHVDNTPPVVPFEVPSPYVASAVFDNDPAKPNRVVWMPRIGWNHIEANPLRLEGFGEDPAGGPIRTLDLSKPTYMLEAQSGTDEQRLLARRYVAPLADADYVGLALRVEATDKGGNRTANPRVQAVEQLAITGLREVKASDREVTSMRGAFRDAFVPPEYRDMELSDAGILSPRVYQLWVDETIKAKFVGIGLRLRNYAAGAWTDPAESLVGDFYPFACGVNGQPDLCRLGVQRVALSQLSGAGPVMVPLDLSKWRPGRYRIQIRAMTDSAQEYLSPEMEFTIEEYVSLSVDKDGVSAILGYRLNRQPDKARVLISARPADDPRYAVPREILSDTSPPYTNEGEGLIPFKPVDLAGQLFGDSLRACTDYTLTGYVTPGAIEGQPQEPVKVTAKFSTRCLDVKYYVAPEAAESCNAEPSQRQIVVLKGHDGAGVPLTLLEFGRAVPSGDDILFNVNQPVDGKEYRFVIDSAKLPVGTFPYFARLTNLNGRKETQPIQLVVDHEPPAVEFLYPKDGQRLCAAPVTDAKGDIRNLLIHELRIEDQNSFDFSVEYGIGADPVAWMPAAGLRAQTKCTEKELPTAECVQLLGGLRAYDSNEFDPAPPPQPFLHARIAGPAAAVEAHGELSSRVTVFDKGGYKACRQVSYFLDGKVEISDIQLGARLISPNGDGKLDSTTFRLTADELVEVEVRIQPGYLDAAGSVKPAGAPVRTLAKRMYPAGEVEIEWDGRNDGGGLVADGYYVATLAINDACGNRMQRSLMVEVDATPPDITIKTPHNGDTLSLAVSIDGSVADAHLSGYRVAVGKGLDPESWQPLAAGDRPVSEGLLANWNTYGLDGDYTIQVFAHDAAQNEREVRLPVKVVAGAALIQAVETIPQLFSPNGDGRREETRLRVITGAETKLTATVLDGSNVVRVLADRLAAPAGLSVLPWDGKDAAGHAVPDKRYVLRVVAELAANPAITQAEAIEVEVDGTPPTISALRPDGGFAKAGASLMASIADRNFADYKVYLTATPAAPVWREVGAGTAAGPGLLLGSLEGLPDGQYAFRVVANDLAENMSTVTAGIEIDSVPPQVTLSAPAAASYLSKAKGLVPVKASIVEKNLKHWQLMLDDATVLASGDTFPADGALHQWDVAAVADGAHTLSLVGEDRAGNLGSAKIDLVVDNTLPVVGITKPADGQYTGRPGPIVGTAKDANLKAYLLELAPGPKGTANAWQSLATGDRSVDAGALANWQVLPADGEYTLRITAVDLAGNQAQAAVQVTVDTTPPDAPLNLKGSLQDRFNAKLSWTASASGDVVGYRLYRAGAAVNAELLVQTEFLDSGLPQGRYKYVVKALDRAGWESAASNEVELAVKLVGPAVQIQQPVKGSVVGGLVDVRGTAAGDADFKEYRLYVGSGDAPADWTLLRRSPTPVMNDVLAQWNTLGLPENAVFTLKLEGEDTVGNLSADRTTVSVDNQPPAAPVGLVATKSGSDVRLAWNANTEADLAGYLVFRDERIANAAGAVVGSLKPYLITPATYLDLKVADGERTYYVLAMDKAGNLSDPSNRVSVTLDTHPPHAVIASPVAGTTVDKNVYINATAADTDIARVQFQYRPLPGGVWINLGAPVLKTPYTAYWDTAALVRGDYELRAIATDNAGNTDPSPGAVTVTVAVLARPEPPLALAAKVTGGQVDLTWTASPTATVVRYWLTRVAANGNTLETSVEAASGTRYADMDVADGSYRYSVVAESDVGNLSNPSNDAPATVYTPVLEQPYTPTLAGTFTLAGSQVPPAATVGIGVDTGNGTQPVATVAANTNGNFLGESLALASGHSRFSVTAQDAAGNTSKVAKIHMYRGSAPTAPTGLTASAAGNSVTLGWVANPEADIAGYRVFRNEQPMLADYGVSGLTAQASRTEGPTYSNAARVVDGDKQGWNGYWGVYGWTGQSVVGEWVELDSLVKYPAKAVTLHWRSYSWQPTVPTAAASRVQVRAWDGEVWVPVATTDVDINLLTTQIEIPGRYVTDKLRIVIMGVPEWRNYVELAEVVVTAERQVAGIGYTDTVPDGKHRFTVTAVNRDGFESLPSPAVAKGIGDVVGPAPVILSAAVTGADVQLSWTASASADVASYELWRDGVLLSSVTAASPRQYVDVNRPNGSYVYVVQALDGVGNRTPSNDAPATVAVPLPAAPVDLSASARDAGGVVDLAWTYPAAGGVAASYDLFRSELAGGPYLPLSSGIAGQAFADTDVVNGRTYYYVVRAQDAAGNAGPLSNEASATPRDRIAPEPPVLTMPTTAATPFVTGAASTRLGGFAEAAATVVLAKGGQDLGSTPATAEQSELTNSAGSDRAALSPDGRFMAWGDSTTLIIQDFSTGNVVLSVAAAGDKDIAWFRDSRRLAFTMYDQAAGVYRVGVLDLDTRQTRYVGSFDYLTYNWGRVGMSQDGNRLAVVGSQGGRDGLWILDLATGIPRLVVAEATDSFQGRAAWAAGADRIAVTVANRVRVVAADGTPVLAVETGGDHRNPDWLDEGHQLVVEADQADGSSHLVQVDVDAGSLTYLTGGLGTHRQPAVSPDRKVIAYWNGNQVVSLSRTDGSEQIVKPIGQTWNLELRWLSGGHLSIYNYYWGQELTRIDMPGRFDYGPVALLPGDNMFTAYAVDAAGNRSRAAMPIVVRKAVEGMADLAVAVEDIQVQPAVPLPASRAVVQVRVRNIGDRPSVAATATVLAIDSRLGTSAEIFNGQVPALAAGEETAVTGEWSAGAAGAYRILAVVDPENRVVEADERNNAALRELTVADRPIPTLRLETDRQRYQANSEVAARATAINSGQPADFRLRLKVEDGAGYEVASLPEVPLPQLGMGEVRLSDLRWNTGGVFAGDYRLHGWLLGADDKTIVDAVAPFAIVPSSQLTPRVQVDRPSYTANEDVTATASLAFDRANAPLEGVVARLRLLSPDAAVLAEKTQPLGPLVDGARADISLTWNVGTASAGSYRVAIDALLGADTIAGATTDFAVTEAVVPQFQAAFALDIDVVAPGEPAVANVTMRNLGNVALADVGLVLMVRDPLAPSSPLTRIPVPLGAAVGATATAPVRIETTGYPYKRLDVLLLAPSAGQSGAATLQTRYLNVVDRVPPQVGILAPANGSWLNTVPDFGVRAVDRETRLATVEYRVDGNNWMPLPAGDASNGMFGVALAGLADGPHTAEARATDAVGNVSVPAAVGFSLDRVPPTVAIDGVANGQLYNTERRPTVRVADANLAESLVTLNGQPYVSGDVIAADGRYVLNASGRDKAANSTALGVVFEIDRTPPTIRIVGVVDQGKYPGPVTPQIEVTDVHLDTVLIALDGILYGTGTPIAAPGDHILFVQARDKAGNESMVRIFFTIGGSDNPPAVALAMPVQGAILKGDVAVAAVATDQEGPVAAVEAQVDGGGWLPLTLVDAATHGFGLTLKGLADGRHVVAVRASDSSGQYSPIVSAAFTADNTPPLVKVGGVADGGRYNKAVTPVIDVTDANLDTTVVKLDGKPFVSGTAVAADGRHQLSVEATDKAGNRTAAAIGFDLDTTAPVAAIVMPTAGATLDEDRVTVSATGSDMSQVVKMEVSLDDQPWTDMAAPATGSDRWTKGFIDLTKGSHTVKVRASDAFGNVSAVVAVPFSVSEQASNCVAGTLKLPESVAIGSDMEWVRTVRNGCRYVVERLPVTATLVNTRTGVSVATLWDTLDLALGAADERKAVWRVDGAAGDVVAAKLTVVRGGRLVELAAGSVKLVAPPPRLKGSLVVSSQSVVPGESLQVDRLVTNLGVSIDNAKIRLILAKAADGSVLTEFADTVHLTAQDTNRRTVNWQAAGLVPGEAVRLSLVVEAAGVSQMLAQETVAIVAAGTRIDALREPYRRPRILALVDCGNSACTLQGGRSLDTVLAGMGVTYQIVPKEDDFLLRLGCEWYNVIWIDAHAKLSEAGAQRVREAAQLGVGVVLLRQPGDFGAFEQAAGMKVLAGAGAQQAIRLQGDWLGNSGELPVDGSVFGLEALPATQTQPSATVIANYADGSPAFSVSTVGDGAVGMAGFDVVASALKSPAVWTPALNQLLGHLAQPVAEPVAPRTQVPHTLRLTSRQDRQVTLAVTAKLPSSGATAQPSGIAAKLAQAMAPNPTWTVILKPGESKVLTVVVSAPVTSGRYDLTWDISTVVGRSRQLLMSQIDTIAVRGIDVIRRSIADDLRDLPIANEPDRLLRDDAKALVESGLQALDRSESAQALTSWLAAADKLRAITGTDVNLPLADLDRMAAELQHRRCDDGTVCGN